jgi:hypothetical protein
MPTLHERKRPERSVRTDLLPLPNLPPVKPHGCGMGDDQPDFLRWLREQEERNDTSEGETPWGCDYPDGPLAPNGCPW